VVSHLDTISHPSEFLCYNLGRFVTSGQTGRQLADMIGHMRGKVEQRDRLIWTGLIAAGVALLIGLLGSPTVASALPFGWNGTVASVVMGQRDRWDAGGALMKAANPQGWNKLVADWHLVSGDKANVKAISACESEAVRFHKAQDCRITVPEGT
jgi:hypothetical protein